MYSYEDKLPIDICVTRPDARYYLLLDRQLDGCRAGLHQAEVYIREAFMIHNIEFKDIFMRLAVKLLNDMEVLAEVMHQLHGEDDRYYDESNDDTPVFEFIRPCDCFGEDSHNEEHHHVNNDMTAAVMRSIEFEKHRVELYDKLLCYMDDEGVKQSFTYLKGSATKSLHTLKNLMTILTTHTETKDFGLDDSHDAFDLDTSNYFDKPNPTFINPSEVNDFHE